MTDCQGCRNVSSRAVPKFHESCPQFVILGVEMTQDLDTSPVLYVFPDILMAGMAYALFSTYHLILYFYTVYHPMQTTIGQNHRARKLWCTAITGKPESSIMAVQTLRNGMMASQLLASTSFTITSALAAIMLTTDWNSKSGFGLGTTGVSYLANETVMPPIKLFVLLLWFIVAFFFYLLSIRAYYHASFLVTIPVNYSEFVDAEYVARILVRGSNFQSLGTRAYYAAFLALLWMFGPVPMVVASVLLALVLYKLDYVPEPKDDANSPLSGDSEQSEECEVLRTNAETIVI